MNNENGIYESLSEHLQNDCKAKKKEDCPFYRDVMKVDKDDDLGENRDVDSLRIRRDEELDSGIKKLGSFVPGVSIRMVDTADECMSEMDSNIRKSIAESEYDFFKSQIAKYHAMKTPKMWKIINRTPKIIKKCALAAAFKSTKIREGIDITTEGIDHATSLLGDGTTHVGKNHNDHLVPTSFFDELLFHLDRPAAVFKSTRARGINPNDSYNGSLLALFNVKDAKTDTFVVVPIILNDPTADPQPDGKRFFIVKSAYGKSELLTSNGSSYSIADDKTPYKEFSKWIEDSRRGNHDGELLYVDNDQIEEMKKADKRFAASGIMWPRPGDKKFPNLLHPSKFRGHGLGLLMMDYFDDNGVVRNDSDDINKEFKKLMEQLVEGVGDYNEVHQKLSNMLMELAKVRGWTLSEDGTKYTKKVGDKVLESYTEPIDYLDGDDNLITSYKDMFDHNNVGKRMHLIEKGGEPIGWYNRKTGEVCLVKGKADITTLCHELGWHATYHWAEKNAPELFKKMRQYAKEAPESVNALVKERYGEKLDEDVLLDEIGAERFTEEDIEKIKDSVKKEESIGWFRKVKSSIGKIYGALKTAFSSKSAPATISDSKPKDVIRRLVEAMIGGKGVESVAKDEMNFISFSYGFR